MLYSRSSSSLICTTLWYLFAWKSWYKKHKYFLNTLTELYKLTVNILQLLKWPQQGCMLLMLILVATGLLKHLVNFFFININLSYFVVLWLSYFADLYMKVGIALKIIFSSNYVNTQSLKITKANNSVKMDRKHTEQYTSQTCCTLTFRSKKTTFQANKVGMSCQCKTRPDWLGSTPTDIPTFGWIPYFQLTKHC